MSETIVNDLRVSLKPFKVRCEPPAGVSSLEWELMAAEFQREMQRAVDAHIMRAVGLMAPDPEASSSRPYGSADLVYIPPV